jgi:hypothetical protein
MPWYDESDPDYTELDKVIAAVRDEAYQAGRADALAGVHEQVVGLVEDLLTEEVP